MENWLPIAGYEGLYEVSDLARVRRLATFIEMPPSRRHPEGWIRTQPGGILSPGPSGEYFTVSLCRDGKPKSFGIHQLVCAAFNGPRPFEGAEVCHWDGCGRNNLPSNLYWGSRSQNMLDITRHGRNVNASKTKCKRGHEFVPGSFTVLKSGSRRCKLCRKVRGD